MINMARVLIVVPHPPAAEVQMTWRPTESINLKSLGPMELLSRIYTKRGGLFPSQKSRIQKVSVCLKTEMY